jgi:hypothetical protein
MSAVWESVGAYRPRPALWRLVMVTVLAGLLHVLGCAHGPQVSGAAQADTLPGVAASVSAYAPPAVVVATLCTHGSDTGCAGDDEPATSAGRADLPVPALGGGLVECGAAGVRRMPGLQALEGDGGCRAQSRARAALGVWRT